MTDNPYSGPDSANENSEQKKGPRIWVVLLTVFGIIAVLVAFLLPAVRQAGPAARRTQCKNNLRQITVALSNYESTYGVLPPAYTVDRDGKPLHSWRTLILPYVDQQQLYETIDLSKPWKDPANFESSKAKIGAYQCPEAFCPANYTTSLAIVAPNSCFRPAEPRRLAEITDSPAETLMLIEVASEHAVHWMSPQDAGEPLVMGFGSDSKLAHHGGTHAAFVDGSVRFLSAKMPAAGLRALISISGNDEVGPF